ncbi:MAG: 23S rRNA (uracil1939-C5)-methyltransferase [Kiritimatiellia bacterium]|jgi:23S rRNA (uracil1939-C5)-methyltransferase
MAIIKSRKHVKTEGRGASPKRKEEKRRSSTSSFDYAAPPESSEPIELTVERLADDGRGIASDQGKTVFIEGALVGETVLTTITKRSNKYSEGRVKALLASSPERITPPCPIFSRCGGCSVQYMAANKQLEFKQASVLSQLSRWADVQPEQLLPAITGPEYGYRQRVRLAVEYTKDAQLYFGFREVNSRRIVSVDQCAVLEPPLQSLLLPLKTWLLSVKPKVVSHIELLNSVAGPSVVIRHERKLGLDERVQLAQLLCLSIDGKSTEPPPLWFQGEKGAVLENIKGEAVDPRLQYSVHADQALALSFHPQDFIQSNRVVNQSMVTQAVEWLAPQADEHIVDLFCGIGNFSLPLAQRAKWVTGVEGVNAMVARARDNAVSNQVDNITFVKKDLLDADLSVKSITNVKGVQGKLTVDGLLLDPPRSGAKAICHHIRKLLPQRIVYVSCDSSSFARDTKLLIDQGYSLSRLGVMDMFPQTAHIELMALFTLSHPQKAPSAKLSAKQGAKSATGKSGNKRNAKLTLKLG